MIELLNTDTVPDGERYKKWCDFVCNCNILLNASRSADPTAPFSARMHGAAVEDILMHSWSYATPVENEVITIERHKNHIAMDTFDAYILVYNRQTDAQCIQGNREKMIPANTFCLFTSQPYRVLNKNVSNGMLFAIPKHHLQNLLYDPDATGPRFIPANYGVARLLLEFCKELPKLTGELPAIGSKILAMQFASLIALAFEPTQKNFKIAESTLVQQRYKTIVNYIDQNLSDPLLSASTVAEKLNISPSYLSRLLSDNRTSFHQAVRMARVRKASIDILNSKYTKKSLTEIAFESGFSSTSHFSRCFKERYGISPRDYKNYVKESS